MIAWFTRHASTAGIWIVAATLLFMTSACTTAWLSAYFREQERKEALRPVRRETPAQTDAQRIIRCRAYGGTGFRQQNVDWKREIRRQFEEANRLLGDANGRFELVDILPWEHSGGQTLPDDLTALAGYDNGNDVDFVMGYVASLPLFTDAIHQLGMARLAGRHGVTRGIDDHRELEAMSQQLRFSAHGDVEELHLQRLRHKKAVILVHEWAHAMGATHRVGSAQFLMNPFYGTDRSEFSPENARVIEIALRNRVGPGGDYDRWVRELIRYFESLSAADPDEQEALAVMKSVAGGALPGAARASPWQGVQDKDHEELNAVIDDFNAGRSAEAWTRLAKLLKAYRDNPELHSLACQVAIKVPDADGKSVCELARLVAKGDPRPAAALFLQTVRAGTPTPDALALLREACERIPTARHVGAGWWSWFVQVAIDHGGLSCAEVALQKVEESERATELAASIIEARNTFGLVAAPGETLSLDDELEAVRVVKEIDALIARRRLNEADALATEATARRRTAGTLASQCEVNGHRKRYSVARGYCQQALDLHPKNGRATFLLAVLELRAGNQPAAQGLLERSIADAPSQERSWVLLGQLYQSQGRRTDCNRLRERFKARHGRTAPF